MTYAEAIEDMLRVAGFVPPGDLFDAELGESRWLDRPTVNGTQRVSLMEIGDEVLHLYFFDSEFPGRAVWEARFVGVPEAALLAFLEASR